MALEATRLTRFAGSGYSFIFPDNQADYRDNFGDMVLRTQRISGADGGYDEVGDEAGAKAIGNVSIGFTLVASSRSEMTAKRDAVRSMLYWGRQRLYMQPSDPNLPERFCDAKVNNISIPEQRNKQTDVWQPVRINFQVPFPYWQEQGTESASWGDGTLWGTTANGGSEKKWGGTATPYSCAGLETDVALNVGGNAVTQARITLAVPSGKACTNPVIERLVANVVVDRLEYPYPLIAGDTLEINSRAASVTKNGTDAYTSSFDFLHPDFFRLIPGANAIKVKFDDPADEADVTFRWFTLWS